jgi:hypothetical protein
MVATWYRSPAPSALPTQICRSKPRSETLAIRRPSAEMAGPTSRNSERISGLSLAPAALNSARQTEDVSLRSVKSRRPFREMAGNWT